MREIVVFPFSFYIMRNIVLNITLDCSVMMKMNWERGASENTKKTTHLGDVMLIVGVLL